MRHWFPDGFVFRRKIRTLAKIFTMKKITCLLLGSLFSFLAFGQTDGPSAHSDSPPVFSPEKKEVIATVQRLFDGMRAGDSSVVRAVFHPSATLQTAMADSKGIPMLRTSSVDRFVEAVGMPHDEIWDEKIWSYSVQIDGNLATVWTPYTFFLGEKMSHCGVNSFLLFHGEEGWKIFNIADNRRTVGCQTAPDEAASAIHRLLDDWHHAAAVADEDTFFGSMAEDGIYLGTDATERWLRDDMREWSQQYFDRESAWSFKATKRHLYFADDGQLAWFEEELDTWMGVCRGSGVVQKFAEGWQIRHYNLAVTVPNEVINGFIELVKNAPKKD